MSPLRWPRSAAQRARLAVSLLLLVAAGNAHLGIHTLQKLDKTKEGGAPDPYIAALADVRRRLPSDARVGYLNTNLTDADKRKRDLFLVRYAVAPVCLAEGAQSSLVLVNGNATLDPQRAGGSAGELLEDFGNGFRLYRPVPPS